MNKTEYGHSITFIAQNWKTHPNFTYDDLYDVGNSSGDNLYGSDATTRLHVDRNTWEDWGLIPSSRPTLPHPQQKTNVVDIPNQNGALDLSWSVNPYPVFGTRDGSFEFIYNPVFQKLENRFKPWLVLYSEISEFLHGRKLRMVLEDDPSYYYEGRFWVESWNSNTDGSGSTITIGYSVEPFKMSILSSLDEWEWDPFNFYNGTITPSTFTINLGDRKTIGDKDSYSDKIHTNAGSTPYANSPWNNGVTSVDSDTKILSLFGLVGSKPQIPIIRWSPNNTGTGDHKRKLIVNYVNYAYGIDYGRSGIRYKYMDPDNLVQNSSSVKFLNNGNPINVTKKADGTTLPSEDQYSYYAFQDMDMIFCDSYQGEYQFIQFIGNGTVRIDFHRGSL